MCELLNLVSDLTEVKNESLITPSLKRSWQQEHSEPQTASCVSIVVTDSTLEVIPGLFLQAGVQESLTTTPSPSNKIKTFLSVIFRYHIMQSTALSFHTTFTVSGQNVSHLTSLTLSTGHLRLGSGVFACALFGTFFKMLRELISVRNLKKNPMLNGYLPHKASLQLSSSFVRNDVM